MEKTKIKVKYPRHLFVDLDQVKVVNKDGLRIHGIGVVDVRIGEDGVAVQKPGAVNVDLIYPLRAEDQWVPHEMLMPHERICTLVQDYRDAVTTLQGSLARVEQQLSAANFKLREIAHQEALDEASSG